MARRITKVPCGGECPNCGAILGIEETDWGCGSCGYPNNDDDFDEEDDDFDPEIDDVLTEEERK